jgi:hypothetical protein
MNNMNKVFLRKKCEVPWRIMRSRKGQFWISDYSMSLLIFIAAALIAIKIIMGGFSTNTAFVEIKSEASKISEVLLSEGVPPDWNTANSSYIIRLGLLNSSQKLDNDKVIKAMNPNYINYSILRAKLQTKYDFLVIFENAQRDMLEFSNNCTIGSPSVSIYNQSLSGIIDCHNPVFTSIDYKDMIRITRYAASGDKIIRMEVFVWK